MLTQTQASRPQSQSSYSLLHISLQIQPPWRKPSAGLNRVSVTGLQHPGPTAAPTSIRKPRLEAGALQSSRPTVSQEGRPGARPLGALRSTPFSVSQHHSPPPQYCRQQPHVPHLHLPRLSSHSWATFLFQNPDHISAVLKSLQCLPSN